MNALDSLTTGNVEENQNVTSLLKSTHEVERRIQEVYRWWRLWQPDVREGWQLLGRYRVSHPDADSLLDLSLKPSLTISAQVLGCTQSHKWGRVHTSVTVILL